MSNPQKKTSVRALAAASVLLPPAGAGIPLWQQMQQVAGVLAAIRGGSSSVYALKTVKPLLRPGAQALVFHILRCLGQAEALRRKLASRTPAPLVDALLCSALALGWEAEGAPYEPFTLVDQTVEAAKRHPVMRAQASFVNACLRRFLRERDALVEATRAEPMATWNHPRWWIDRLRKDHPQQWQEILLANNRQAPMVLRINKQKSTPAQYLRTLNAIDKGAFIVGDAAVRLGAALPVDRLPGFAEGVVSVQDAGAQLAAPLLLEGLDLDRPLRVLDACAAPGGKTAHLLEYAGNRPGFEVVALDIDAERCERIYDNLDRLGLSAQVLAADARAPATWWPSACNRQPFDAILLDAPCTASGIVRRHPDVRWLRRESDIEQLAIIQAGLLSTLWPLLKPGGRLLYCTCSVFRAEGSERIQTFLAHHTDARLLPSPGHLIPRSATRGDALPDNRCGDHDGFFYGLLQKSAI